VAYSLAVYFFAIFANAAFSGARAATEFLHLVNPKVHRRCVTPLHRSAFPERMRLDYPDRLDFQRNTFARCSWRNVFRHEYQWDSRRGTDNRGTESIVSQCQRQFRPFQLFQHRHLRLLAVFSRKFSDLQFRTFGPGLALVRCVAKGGFQAGLAFRCHIADQEARYEAQSRTDHRLRQ
jgi:hypothetical protein